jgi:hypothetical protein
VPLLRGVAFLHGAGRLGGPQLSLQRSGVAGTLCPSQSGVFCWWCCATKCSAFAGMTCALCNCWCALAGVIVTFGFWGYAKEALAYWWGFLQPVFMSSCIQVWALNIAPVLFSEDIKKGMKGAFTQDQDTAQQAVAAVQGSTGDKREGLLDEEESAAVAKWNEDVLAYGPLAQSDPAATSDGDLTASVKDAKILVFRKTLMSMSSIAIEQALLIFLLRALCGPPDYEHYAAAIARTLSERRIVSYIGHLRSISEHAAHAATQASSTQIVSKAVNAFWLLF